MVQTRFEKVVPIADTATDLFYDRLFTIAPEVCSVFPDDIKDQEKKLIAMPATAVTNLHQVETIFPAVESLGKRHVAYGTTAQHYEPVGAALQDEQVQARGANDAAKERLALAMLRQRSVFDLSAGQLMALLSGIIPAVATVHGAIITAAPPLQAEENGGVETPAASGGPAADALPPVRPRTPARPVPPRPAH